MSGWWYGGKVRVWRDGEGWREGEGVKQVKQAC